MGEPVAVYVGRELGAYGYDEKPWYQPGARLDAFLGAMQDRGLEAGVVRREAGPATDEDLGLFHAPGYPARLRARCAEDRGSLDRAVPEIVADARGLLEALRRRGGEAPRSELEEELRGTFVPAMTFDAYLGYLSSEGLMVDHEGALRLTPAGRDWLVAEDPWLGGPTLARAQVEVAARWVAGAAIDAARRIARQELRRVFIPIAGFHHAHPDEARLYCLYNDPALAIRASLEELAGPIAYIDIDVHHGDGVYEGFADDPRVVIVDLHEDPSTLFPFTPAAPGRGAFWGRRDVRGRGEAEGTKLNIPLAPNTDDTAYLELWSEAEAFLRAARPQMIVFEAGVDCLAGDPLSHQKITPAAVAEVTRRVVAIAEEHAEGRLLVLGGGGYELSTTAAGWTAVLEALIDA